MLQVLLMLEALLIRERMLQVRLTVVHAASCHIYRLRLLSEVHHFLMSVCPLVTAWSLGFRRGRAKSCTGQILMDLLHGLTYSHTVEFT